MKVTSIFVLVIMMFIMLSCSKDADPIPSISHPDGWMTNGAENFHGTKVLTTGSEFCTSCHEADYSGGDAGIACADCHADYPHPSTWTTPGNDSSHAAYIKEQYWSMDRCKTCHGDDYQGGSSGESCYDCHPQTGGPEACNTCHGSGAGPVSNILTWAPPKDLYDNLETTAVGVGAHQNHLKESLVTDAYVKDCNLCHPNIMSFDDPLHINQVINIQFGEVATDSGNVTPVWNTDQATCSDTYCHGNFSYGSGPITGNNVTMEWTDVGTGKAACETCHGLPPTGHFNVTTCNGCHGSVVDADFNIIDPEKHINQQADFN